VDPNAAGADAEDCEDAAEARSDAIRWALTPRFLRPASGIATTERAQEQAQTKRPQKESGFHAQPLLRNRLHKKKRLLPAEGFPND
jgi:hypothetical protein